MSHNAEVAVSENTSVQTEDAESNSNSVGNSGRGRRALDPPQYDTIDDLINMIGIDGESENKRSFSNNGFADPPTLTRLHSKTLGLMAAQSIMVLASRSDEASQSVTNMIIEITKDCSRQVKRQRLINTLNKIAYSKGSEAYNPATEDLSAFMDRLQINDSYKSNAKALI